MPVRLVAFVMVSIAVLCGAAAILASVHHEARAARALRHFEEGRAAAASGQLAAAVGDYRASLSLDPRNVTVERELALTLLALGRLSEAESYLAHLLQEDPTNGPLNRGLARIHAARGHAAEARATYQRAIYGEWREPPTGRVETRFELVDYLRDLGAREEILAELLRLKGELPPSETVEVRRVADLLVQEGATEQGVEMLRAASVAAPRDIELLAHLADAQSRAGRAADARATLARAVTLEPRRADLRDRLSVIDRVLALDPTLPRLRLVTRIRRARELLDAVLQQTRTCVTGASAATLQMRDEARRRLRRPAGWDAQAAEQQLDLASQLWQTSAGCRAPTAEAQAIHQVLQRVEAAEDSHR